jgi:hypothetical protein
MALNWIIIGVRYSTHFVLGFQKDVTRVDKFS